MYNLSNLFSISSVNPIMDLCIPPNWLNIIDFWASWLLGYPDSINMASSSASSSSLISYKSSFFLLKLLSWKSNKLQAFSAYWFICSIYFLSFSYESTCWPIYSFVVNIKSSMAFKSQLPFIISSISVNSLNMRFISCSRPFCSCSTRFSGNEYIE